MNLKNPCTIHRTVDVQIVYATARCHDMCTQSVHAVCLKGYSIFITKLLKCLEPYGIAGKWYFIVMNGMKHVILIVIHSMEVLPPLSLT